MRSRHERWGAWALRVPGHRNRLIRRFLPAQAQIRTLEELRLFRGLRQRELSQVALRADAFEAPCGTILAAESSPTREFIVITEGVIEVSEFGKRTRVLGPGDHVGGETLLGVDRPQTLTTKSTVRGYVMGPREFWAVLHQIPAVSVRLYAEASTPSKTKSITVPESCDTPPRRIDTAARDERRLTHH